MDNDTFKTFREELIASQPFKLPRQLRHAIESGRNNPFEASRATDQAIAEELKRHASKPDLLEEIRAASLQEMKALAPQIKEITKTLRKLQLVYLYHLRRQEMADYHLQEIKKIAPKVSGKDLPESKERFTMAGLMKLAEQLPDDKKALFSKLLKTK